MNYLEDFNIGAFLLYVLLGGVAIGVGMSALINWLRRDK